MSNKISDDQVARRAIVYVRQSTPAQVTTNLESQRRQYSLVERARELGFRDVDVIDDDLGGSGSGLAERPGFQRLVAQVCPGQVGAVFCIEVSRGACWRSNSRPGATNFHRSTARNRRCKSTVRRSRRCLPGSTSRQRAAAGIDAHVSKSVERGSTPIARRGLFAPCPRSNGCIGKTLNSAF